MRLQRIVLIFTFLFPLFSLAELKQAKDFLDLSQKMRAELKKDKQENKIAKLKEFEKDLNNTRDEYFKENPAQGNAGEQKVHEFYYVFEPLFKSEKFAKKDCEEVKHQVRLTDNNGITDDTGLSDPAKEALEWLKILCTK
jgi:hypothetical protein